MDTQFLRRVTALTCFGLLLGASVLPAAAQDGPKLYAFSSGALTIGKGALVNGAANEPPIQVPVGFYVIRHPKGNVLFDTGNNDKIITDPSYWGDFFKALKPVNTPDVAIDVQLQKIGLKPDDIKYVVPSHLHLDHGGNVGKFPNSTIVVQTSTSNSRAARGWQPISSLPGWVCGRASGWRRRRALPSIGACSWTAILRPVRQASLPPATSPAGPIPSAAAACA